MAADAAERQEVRTALNAGFDKRHDFGIVWGSSSRCRVGRSLEEGPDTARRCSGDEKEVHTDDAVAIGVSRDGERGYWRIDGMAEMMTTDVRAIMDRTPFDVSAVADLREVLGRDPPATGRCATPWPRFANARRRKEIKPETHLRLGVGEVLLGRYNSGLEHLKRPATRAWPISSAGWPSRTCSNTTTPPTRLPRRPSAGTTPRTPICTGPAPCAALATPTRPRRSWALEKAERVVRPNSTSSRAACSPPKASWSPRRPSWKRPSASTAITTAPSSSWPTSTTSTATTTLAVDYYKRCTERPPVPLAAWINLGVLYEDEMRFREAEQCYRQVLAHDPNHPRARLFFKDCRASKDMYYDEEAEKGYRPQATARDPGHRLRAFGPEPQLPAEDEHPDARRPHPDHRGRASGQQELRRDLAGRDQGDDDVQGSPAGDGARRRRAAPAPTSAIEQPQEVPPEMQAMLAKPISDLNLSVRARKCMTKLGIQTVGELISHTGDELLECKNFGVTSLNEVREKLTHAEPEAQERMTTAGLQSPGANP